MAEVHVNEAYELYQIITDFGDPLEIFREGIQNSFDADATQIIIKVYEQRKLGTSKLIIDIIDDGHGIEKKNIASFFDVANSTKIDADYVSTGKYGYKGHGSKVFFNAEKVEICSKTKDGNYWGVELKDPLEQISLHHKLEYSEFMEPEDLNIDLPDNWDSGFRVRIVAPRHFLTQQTRAKLKHINLRDYCNWYTIIGTVANLYDDELSTKDFKLYLQGLLTDEFKNKYHDISTCDPVPTFVDTPYGECEMITMGHYFPEERRDDSAMKNYAKAIGSNKAYYMFYSRLIYNEEVTASSLSFRLVISLEGYETKRRYDLLLSRQGKAFTEETHTDASRYGLWACKGGVPVEKVDDWLIGGRGVGTYTYMQAFIDCDEFQLTANRGSVKNTEIDKLDVIKDKVNEIFNSKKIQNLISERQEWENFEKTLASIDGDGADLKKRYNAAKKRKKIKFPDGTTITEPGKNSRGYSESETFSVLLALMQKYPDLFSFKLMDYNTTKGIDFVIDHNGSPKYIELKGTLTKQINHPFRYVYKFICYDLDVEKGDEIEDLENFTTKLVVKNNDKFDSPNSEYRNKRYTSYILAPDTASIQSMEIINLKKFLVEVVGATIE